MEFPISGGFAGECFLACDDGCADFSQQCLCAGVVENAIDQTFRIAGRSAEIAIVLAHRGAARSIYRERQKFR
jgi:hypothetical protein